MHPAQSVGDKRWPADQFIHLSILYDKVPALPHNYDNNSKTRVLDEAIRSSLRLGTVVPVNGRADGIGYWWLNLLVVVALVVVLKCR